MQTDDNRLIEPDAVEERTLKPIVKLLLVAGALFLLWGLVSNLPGIDAIVPETAVTFGAVLGAAVTLGIVAVLGYVAFKIEPLLIQALAGPVEVVSDVASMAKHGVLFAAVITAHAGFAPLFTPPLEAVDLAWTYELLFLVLALVPTVVIAVRMYGNVDEVATLVTARLSTAGSEDRSDGTTEPGSTG